MLINTSALWLCLTIAMVLCSGGNAPSYVYRLLSEYYHEKDYEL
jgi:hypothetical protein